MSSCTVYGAGVAFRPALIRGSSLSSVFCLRYDIGEVAVRATPVLSCSCTRCQHDRSHREQESAKDYVPHVSSLPHYVAVAARLRVLYYGHTGGGYAASAPGLNARYYLRHTESRGEGRSIDAVTVPAQIAIRLWSVCAVSSFLTPSGSGSAG